MWYPTDYVEYAKQRLNETILMYKGKAALVQNVVRKAEEDGEWLRVDARYILEDKKFSDKLEAFDYVPVEIGNVNVTGLDGLPDVEYWARTPIRNDWRQGTRQHNCVCLHGKNRLWSLYSVAKSIENKFPSLQECIEGTKAGGEMAWCHEFSINNKRELFYGAIGKIGNYDNDNYLLDNGKQWVEEALKESLK